MTGREQEQPKRTWCSGVANFELLLAQDVGFSLGIELMQLVVVALIVPLLILSQSTTWVNFALLYVHGLRK